MRQSTPTKIVLLIGVAIVGFYVAHRVVDSPDFIAGIMATSVVTLGAFAIVASQREDRRFIIRLWLGALALRFLVAFAVYWLGLRENIAPDWGTYDAFGDELSRYWHGRATGSLLTSPEAQFRSGWGMYYYVAAVYYFIGRNPFTIQLFSCVFGASACVLIYKNARIIYPVERVARISGILAAIAPSMVVWTSQGIKEPLILFLLSAILYLTLKLTSKVRVPDALLLLVCFFGVYSLRHYVFFVAFLASAAAIVLSGSRFSPKRILQGSLLVIVMGTAFSYYGAGEVAEKSFDLEKIQRGRRWSAEVSSSGYGGDVDITDTRAALVYLPLGTLIFLFAPLPWMIKNLNHVIMLPEMIAWWLATPLLFRGFWFAVRHRLRSSLAIGLFTTGLTLAYALFLTNFGTAHRMRVQILGFFIIFISIGWELRGVKARKRHKLRQHSHIPIGGSPARLPGLGSRHAQ